MSVATPTADSPILQVSPQEERKVIFASSLGTVFEWYDFYLYATLAPFFAALFFPKGNDTAALLSAFATYAAGFLVRPFGALVFGRIGDLVGRKYTFMVTIIVMGASTVAVGLLPTYASIGVLAPILLVTLRLLQGLALGGEYGGAATYVAEHAPEGKRGYSTSWIQTTATLGFFLSLLVIGLCRAQDEPGNLQGLGLAGAVPDLAGASRLLDLHPAQAERVAGLPADEGGGQGVEVAAQRQLLALSEQQVRAARPLRRRRRPGGGLVHGAVLRPLLPHHHAQARLADRLHPGRHRAPARDAVLRHLRQPVRPHRPPEDHPRRLPPRGAHLLPALQGADPRREPGARGVPEQPSGERRGHGLQLPRLHRPPRHQVLRLRQGEGLPHQVGALLQLAARGAWPDGDDADRQHHAERMGSRTSTKPP